VILAGRRVNDGMGAFVAQRLVKMLIAGDRPVKGARVGILGLTFKENVPDLRNSRVPDVIDELRQFGVETLVHDPRADAREAREEYGIDMTAMEALRELDGLVLAVPHREYSAMDVGSLAQRVVSGGAIADLKSMLNPREVPSTHRYWSL
jgi:UDP-N-acetyl-D-galactosamine dehydrogenase